MSVPRAFSRELAATLRFAAVIGAVVAAVSVAVFHVEARLTGVVTTTTAHVAVAGFMPAFFSAWVFFVMRRIAWASALASFATGTTLAFAAFQVHGVVLRTGFHGGVATWLLPFKWCERALLGVVLQFGSAPAWDPTPLWALVAVGLGLGVAGLQRAVVVRRRSAP